MWWLVTQNVPVVTISWIFFFGLCFLIFLVLSLCSESHCACCRCLMRCRCCRELCEEDSDLNTKKAYQSQRERNFSDTSIQNTLIVSNSEGGLSVGGNTCPPMNGNETLAGTNSKIPSTSVGPSQEFYC